MGRGAGEGLPAWLLVAAPQALAWAGPAPCLQLSSAHTPSSWPLQRLGFSITALVLLSQLHTAPCQARPARALEHAGWPCRPSLETSVQASMTP